MVALFIALFLPAGIYFKILRVHRLLQLFNVIQCLKVFGTFILRNKLKLNLIDNDLWRERDVPVECSVRTQIERLLAIENKTVFTMIFFILTHEKMPTEWQECAKRKKRNIYNALLRNEVTC